MLKWIWTAAYRVRGLLLGLKHKHSQLHLQKAQLHKYLIIKSLYTIKTEQQWKPLLSEGDIRQGYQETMEK